MTASLPPNPSLENLRKQAKALKKSCQSGDPAALHRVHIHLPSTAPNLADCQFILAREFGFQNWRHLKTAVESANRELSEQFVTTVCLCYGDPHFDHRSFHDRANQLLRESPWLAAATIWSAAAAGNTTAVSAFLDKDPVLVNQPGPQGWPPLICACYSRVEPIHPTHSTYDVAHLLLARGADPNAFMLKGELDERLDQTIRRFTVISGVFGGGDTGMANQKPHPRWRELAELLLEHGANPNDYQSLRITQNRDSTYTKLEILLRHGLNPNSSLTAMALALAAQSGDIESVKLLLTHHTRTDEPFRGKLPWRHAVDRGHLAIANLLEQAGAPIAEINPVERFISLCLAGDEKQARAMLEQDPALLSRVPKHLVLMASNTGRKEAVELALSLGFDPNALDEVTALHNVAGSGNLELMQLLIQHGGSLTTREPFYDGTPVGWADFFDQHALRDALLDTGDICIFDAIDFNRLDRIPDILARDPDALNRPFAKCLTRPPKPADWQTPIERMQARGMVVP